jgi:hypothetical protein
MDGRRGFQSMIESCAFPGLFAAADETWGAGIRGRRAKDAESFGRRSGELICRSAAGELPINDRSSN